MTESIVEAEVQESTGDRYLPKPGKSMLWLLLFGALYFAASALFFMGYTVKILLQHTDMVSNPELQAMVQESVEQYAKTAGGLSGMYLVQFIVLLPIIIWASHFKTQSFKETLGFRKVSLKSLGVWLLIFIGFFILQVLVDVIFKVESGEFLKGVNGSKNVLFIFVLLVVAPLLEEMIFRGYFFKAWRQSWLGLTGTLLVTSALFMSLHLGQYGIIQYIFLFLLSMLLGLAREFTGSIWTPIILHSVNNVVPAIVVVFLGIA